MRHRMVRYLKQNANNCRGHPFIVSVNDVEFQIEMLAIYGMLRWRMEVILERIEVLLSFIVKFNLKLRSLVLGQLVCMITMKCFILHVWVIETS